MSMYRRPVLAVAVGAVVAAISLTACSSSSKSSSAPAADASTAAPAAGSSAASSSAGGSSSAATGALISADRCAQNKAAGHIVYLTSFDLGGDAGVLSEVAAAGEGFYKDMCLDVELRPAATNNAQLVSSGTAQLAGMGNAAAVMAAQMNGAKITGIGTFGNVGAVTVMTIDGGPIKTLKDLEGHSLGYKGTVPNEVTSMLQIAGVDTKKVKFVSVGYDPTILGKGQIDSLEGFTDNEPTLLTNAGYKVKLWDPYSYGVKSTFSTTVVNTAWGEKHPTAVEDFLRATYHAFDWMQESQTNVAAAISYSKSISQSGYDAVHQTSRWTISSGMVTKNLVAGHGVGYQSAALWQPEADALLKYGTIKSPVDVASAQTSKYVDAIYNGSTLIWPATGS